MNKNEIMESVKLNEKGKKTALILVVVASLVAAIAAVAGFFCGKKSRKSGLKKSDRVNAKKRAKTRAHSAKKASAPKEKSVETVAQQPAVAPQQVYVVRPLPEKKQESKAKRFRRHMSAAVASILVVSLVGSGTMSLVPPTTALAAKGSFSGIGRVVSEHTDEPYVILNIVPTSATYKNLELSTGTLGYLVSGQAPIVKDLEKLRDNIASYGKYADRKPLLEGLNGGSGFPEVLYKEAYGGVFGVDSIVSSTSGWTRMFDASPEADNAVTTGIFTGKAEPYKSGDKTGYDFKYVSGTDIWATAGLFSGGFVLSPYSGDSHVKFVPSADGNYVIQDAISLRDIANATSTWVYKYNVETNTYEWMSCTIWDLIADKISGGSSDANGSEHAHVFSTGWWYDGSNHWRICTVDGCSITNDNASQYAELNGFASHEYVCKSVDGDNHEYVCDICGFESGNSGSHVWTEDGRCEVCGAEKDGKTEGGDVTDPVDPDQKTEGEDNNETVTDPVEPNPKTEGEDNENEENNETVTDPVDPPTSSSGEEGSTKEASEDTENMSLDPTVAKNTPVSNGWVRLVEVSPEDEFTEESGGDFYEGSAFDWGSIDSSVWEWLESEGYCVVTFRALEPDESTEGKVLYDYAEVESLGDAGDIYDAYNFIEVEEDDEYGISTLALTTELEGSASCTFRYVGSNQGDYKLTRVANGTGGDNTAVIAVQNVSVYYRCTTGTDWLREYVFNSDDIKIEVRTVRADRVTLDDVADADLIYIEDSNNTIIPSSSVVYNSFTDKDDGSDPDMSPAVASQILYRAAEELVPVIVDHEVAKGGAAVGNGSFSAEYYKDSNYSLLAKALQKNDLVGFCEAMDRDDGSMFDNIKIYFDQESTEYLDKDDNGYHYVNRNVYVVSDESLVSSEFPSKGLDSGFAEVLAAIKAENTMLSDEDKLDEKVTPAMAVQYIINFSVGMVGEFDDLTILELQPTANTLSDLTTYTNNGYTKLCWKTESMTTAKQILSSKTEFNVHKDIKSVAEFNGEWEDINGTYDIVFIGLDGQRLYRDSNNERTAMYNNSSLNGQVYHSGDDSGVGRYDANDITAQKMTDLLNYMKAGYPILVENNFFTNESAQKSGASEINTRYVGSDTLMHQFLSVAVTDYKDCIFTVSDAMSSPMFMTQVRMAKPRISLVSDSGEEISGKVQSLTPDENGDYRGTITYRITNNKGEDYLNYDGTVIHLYADYNYDGNFAPEEEVGEYTNYGGTIEVVASDMGPGILPWKLEVTDAGNAFRRDSVQGYFVLGASSMGELKVLQITEKLNDDRVNLKTMFNTKEDSLLGYYLRSAEHYTNTEFIFETVNTSQLETELGKNPKYLEQWDVVVMTLDGGAESQVVTDAVTSYADSGRSLLVCAQGQEGENNSGGSRLGLSAALLGQSENNSYIFTYTALGISSSAQYLRYNGLSRDMIAGSYNLKAETVNDGSISYYPYQLGSGSIAVADGTLLRAPTYLLDFENNLSSESNATYVTAWYTFASDGESSEYGVSPRDARNNYYCYSKGNVVYLAQSEYPYTYNSQDMTTTDGAGSGESQLFVNALMAAYSAGVHNANVHIVAGFAPDSADVESIPVPFDQDWLEAAALDGSDGMLDNTVDVYFRFRDSNMARNKTVQIEFLREEPLGADFLEIGVNMIPFTSQIWAVKDGRLTLVEPDQLVPGQTYRIEAPVVTMDNNSDKNKADIYVVIRTTFMRGGKECVVTSYDKVSLNRAELRPLE